MDMTKKEKKIKRNTEWQLIATQTTVKRTNYITAKIDNTRNSECTQRGDSDETVHYTISEGSKKKKHKRIQE